MRENLGNFQFCVLLLSERRIWDSTKTTDVQIFDVKNIAVGTRFIFDRYEDGYTFGHLQGPNERVDVKKTTEHVSVYDAETLEPNSGNLDRWTRKRIASQKLLNYSKQ